MTTSTGSTTTPRPRPAKDRKKPGSATNAFPANTSHQHQGCAGYTQSTQLKGMYRIWYPSTPFGTT